MTEKTLEQLQREALQAQIDLCKAEAEKARQSGYADLAQLTVSILNDKHTGSNRSVPAAVAEAVAVMKGVAAEMTKPDFWGAVDPLTGGGPRPVK
jgi:hypothetical protein